MSASQLRIIQITLGVVAGIFLFEFSAHATQILGVLAVGAVAFAIAPKIGAKMRSIPNETKNKIIIHVCLWPMAITFLALVFMVIVYNQARHEEERHPTRPAPPPEIIQGRQAIPGTPLTPEVDPIRPPPMSDESEDFKRSWAEAQVSVLDRLVEAGWVEDFSGAGDDIAIQWSVKGYALLREIRTAFITGGEMAQIEKIAFISIINKAKEP